MQRKEKVKGTIRNTSYHQSLSTSQKLRDFHFDVFNNICTSDVFIWILSIEFNNK